MPPTQHTMFVCSEFLAGEYGETTRYIFFYLDATLDWGELDSPSASVDMGILMSVGDELGSRRTSVDMGIPMSVGGERASWIHPGSALTWEFPCQ